MVISSLESTMSNRFAPKLLAEFIGTFSFVFIGAGAAAVVGDGVGLPGIVAIAFAHSTAVAGRAGSLAPLAIGMTLTFNILMGGALTGAPFNPARALGPMVATGNFSDAWLYVTAPIVGAIVAAILHTGLARLAHEGIAAEPHRVTQAPAE